MTFRPFLPALFALPLIVGGCFLPAPLGMAPLIPAFGVAPVGGTPIAGTPPTSPPWFNPGKDSLKYVEAAGIDVLATEAFEYHVHAYLTVYWNGAQVPVPANLGISPENIWISVLHTHDQSGKVHVEAPAKMQLTLNQFFTTWNVSLGGATVYEDGKPVADGKNLVFRDAQTIAVVYGPAPSMIPNKYPFDDAGTAFAGQPMPSAAPSAQAL